MSEKRESVEELAELFHDTYERLAPQYGYVTREDTREFDPNSKNGQLMIEVVQVVLNYFTDEDQLRAENEILKDLVKEAFATGYFLYKSPDDIDTMSLGAGWGLSKVRRKFEALSEIATLNMEKKECNFRVPEKYAWLANIKKIVTGEPFTEIDMAFADSLYEGESE